MAALSGVPGTYVLALRLHRARRVRVGRLGTVDLPAGWYLYVGSAHGPGGLRARLARHRRRVSAGHKRPHWHIDHVREQAGWGGAWARAAVPAGDPGPAGLPGERLECAWAAALRALPGAAIPAPGLGASDCRCPGHLVRVPVLPGDGWFAAALGAERIDMDEDNLDELFNTLGAGDDEAREKAALALAGREDVPIERLAAVAATGGADARWWAARTMGAIGDGRVVAPLLRALGDVDADVRACAALALGHTGAAEAAVGLAARLADESSFVVGIAADALAMIGPPAVPALLDLLQAEQPRTRLLAVRALARIKDPSAIGPVFKLLDDPSYVVRFYADEALEAMGVGMVYVAP